jgi:hypothetical protein
MRLMAALTPMVALALVACGGLNGYSGNEPPVVTPTAALASWAAFPAGQTPRPVVLIANRSPDGGFGGDSAKIAALCHKFTSAITLSTAAPRNTTVIWSTGAEGTYPSISAAAALAALAQPGPGTSESYCKTVDPLVFSAVRFGAYGYVTDRGSAQIDSWLFTTTAFSGAIAHPALAPSAVWNADLLEGSGNGTIVSDDGRTLKFGFTGGSGTGPCAVHYQPLVAESQSAVAVAVQAAPSTSACNGPSDAVGYLRTVYVSLAGPLGGRVVLDATGNLATVCPAIKPDC